MSKKYTGIILRSGKVTDATVNPPTPLDKETEEANYLLYCKQTTLAVNGLHCEKIRNHEKPETAVNMVRMRFKKSSRELNYILCASCASELMAQYAPYGNTGLTNNSSRVDGANK